MINSSTGQIPPGQPCPIAIARYARCPQRYLDITCQLAGPTRVAPGAVFLTVNIVFEYCRLVNGREVSCAVLAHTALESRTPSQLVPSREDVQQ